MRPPICEVWDGPVIGGFPLVFMTGVDLALLLVALTFSWFTSSFWSFSFVGGTIWLFSLWECLLAFYLTGLFFIVLGPLGCLLVLFDWFDPWYCALRDFSVTTSYFDDEENILSR